MLDSRTSGGVRVQLQNIGFCQDYTDCVTRVGTKIMLVALSVPPPLLLPASASVDREFMQQPNRRAREKSLWPGEYLVLDLDRFVGMDLSVTANVNWGRIVPQITKVIDYKPMTFPLKERYDYLNLTLEGRELALRLQEPPLGGVGLDSDTSAVLGAASPSRAGGPPLAPPPPAQSASS